MHGFSGVTALFMEMEKNSFDNRINKYTYTFFRFLYELKNGNPRAFPIFIFKSTTGIEIKPKPENSLFFNFISDFLTR